ncbi:putative plasmalogen synthase [Helianthus annuus]|nr:putative plasmalogen synthase [Helianthus annuus]
MYKIFMQFHSFMEVEHLPVISPSQHQKESVACLAERIGNQLMETTMIMSIHIALIVYKHAVEIRKLIDETWTKVFAHPDVVCISLLVKSFFSNM